MKRTDFTAGTALSSWLPAFLISISNSASAINMRADFYDPTHTVPTLEARYYQLAQQPRFEPVGAMTYGAPGFTNYWVNFCAATLISPTTILTAAHCFMEEKPTLHTTTHRELSNVFILIGALDAPTHVLRITDYKLHPDWVANLYGTTSAGGDLAIAQVYDATTGGPVNVPPPAALFVEDTEAGTEFPSIVGYGDAAYGTDVVSQGGELLQAGGKPLETGGRGVLRGGLTIPVVLGTASTPNDLLKTTFHSPEFLRIKLSLPQNFLEGAPNAGDSGGPLMLPDPLGGSEWQVAGVVSQNLGDENHQGEPTWYDQYELWPAHGGAVTTYTRISSKASWIYANLFASAGTPYPPASTQAPAGLQVMSAGSPITFSTPIAGERENKSLTVRYVFVGNGGSVNVALSGQPAGSFGGQLNQPSSAIIPLDSESLIEGIANDGARSDSLSLDLSFTLDAPAGTALILLGLEYPGISNGSFEQGMSGWDATDPAALSVVDTTPYVGLDEIFSDGFEP